LPIVGAQIITAQNVALVGFVNINNYQGNGLNLVNNVASGIVDGTAVTAVAAFDAGQANQQVSISSSISVLLIDAFIYTVEVSLNGKPCPIYNPKWSGFYISFLSHCTAAWNCLRRTNRCVRQFSGDLQSHNHISSKSSVIYLCLFVIS